MNQPSSDQPSTFHEVADWCQSHLTLQHSPDVGTAFGTLLRTLADIANIPAATATATGDHFDQLKMLETRVNRLLTDLCAAHTECLDQRQARSIPAAADDLSTDQLLSMSPDSPGSTTKVFVYGTLKRGFSRSTALVGQTFIGPARTTADYRIFDCGSYPGLVEVTDGLCIKGELWEVDAACLADLDDIEGVSLNLYHRARVRLEAPDDMQDVEAYFYKRNVAGLRDCGTSWT